jgi:hypothetical protein
MSKKGGAIKEVFVKTSLKLRGREIVSVMLSSLGLV